MYERFNLTCDLRVGVRLADELCCAGEETDAAKVSQHRLLPKPRERQVQPQAVQLLPQGYHWVSFLVMNLMFRTPVDRIAHEPYEQELVFSVISVITVTFLIFKSLGGGGGGTTG